MTVAIRINITRKNAYEVALSVYRKLTELGVKVIITDDVKDDFSQLGAEFMPIDKAVKESDILIAVGGDGTIIHSAHYAAEYDKPILGINAGRLGFLAGVEKTELSLLGNLINSDYEIDERMMLSVKHYEDGAFVKEYYCLNDVVVARGASMHVCDITARDSNGKISDFITDGLIVATPTGSTAYSFSAGGPVVDTSLDSLILTPVCSHTVHAPSMIFRSDSVIEIRVNNSEVSLPIFSCDGEDGIRINDKSEIVICKAERVTKLIKIKSDSFSDIFTQKLIDRYGY